MPSPPQDAAVFPLAEIQARRKRTGGLYLEFLRVPAMSVGNYALHAGGVDPQTPHAEDEVYHVIRGRGAITIAGRDYPVEPGETIFVAKGVDHRFHSVTEALEILVVFAPAESQPPGPSHPRRPLRSRPQESTPPPSGENRARSASRRIATTSERYERDRRLGE